MSVGGYDRLGLLVLYPLGANKPSVCYYPFIRFEDLVLPMNHESREGEIEEREGLSRCGLLCVGTD